MTAVSIAIVQPEMLEDLWGLVYPMLKPLVDEDLFLREPGVKTAIEEFKHVLFVASVDGKLEGAAVVDVRKAKNTVATILLLGGENLAAWGPQMNERVTAFAKESGCSHVAAYGRKAWERLWPDFTGTERTFFYKEIA